VSAYVVFEGPDGGGKSTQAQRLGAWLRREGHDVVHLREPGSTPVGEALRDLLLDPSTGEMSGLTEALLFTAARAELIRSVIQPALRAGSVVLVERCYLSTWVYQGVAAPPAQAVPLPLLRELTGRALGETWPDRILVLDVDYGERVRRTEGAAEDRIEARGRDYHEQVRAGYRQLAAEDDRCVLVDAAGDPSVVEAAVREAVAGVVGTPEGR
jgi:dTMP kinase